MTGELYLWLCCAMAACMLVGLALMTRVGAAVLGNLICAAAIAGGAVLTLLYYGIADDALIWAGILLAAAGGIAGSHRIRMIQMPQVVALLNGMGGAASALVALSALLDREAAGPFERGAGALAMSIGALTLTGSLVAAGKLHKLLPHGSVRLPLRKSSLILLLAVLVLSTAFLPRTTRFDTSLCAIILLSGALFGFLFFIRIGGTDMPVCVSFLNALSGFCGALTGMSEENPFLVAAGGIIMAGGLLLTQNMCKAADYSLFSLLSGRIAAHMIRPAPPAQKTGRHPPPTAASTAALAELLRKARRIALIPGAGCVAAHAGKQLKILYEALHKRGADVVFGVHPLAGRLPGHMNVLLVEAGIPYKKLLPLEKINELLPHMDLAIVIGANDVVNTAARDAKDSPIYGKPIIQADLAAHALICNLDTTPGFGGVPNPLFSKTENVTLFLGDASDTLRTLVSLLYG